MEAKFQETLNDILDAINIINNNAATKDDIKAIREDLKVFVTKEDLTEALKPYVTKVDLKAMELSICDKISIQIGQLHGATIELVKKEDAKTLEMLEVMKEKKFFDDNDKKRIVMMEPFAQMML